MYLIVAKKILEKVRSIYDTASYFIVSLDEEEEKIGLLYIYYHITFLLL